jgi:hypothetical protein
MPALLGASLATSGAVGVASNLTSVPSGRVRMLPVHSELAGLFPWGGLRRGGTVSVRGSTSLLLALLAEPTAGDSWAGIVGMPDLGIVAAAELGVAVDRLALVHHPGADLPGVIAALLDGMDLVVTVRGRLSDAQARRLSARARHRGAVLLTPDPWPAADVELRCANTRWSGIGAGYGYLASRETAVLAEGRGAAARPRRADLQLPGAGGAVAPMSREPARTLPEAGGALALARACPGADGAVGRAPAPTLREARGAALVSQPSGALSAGETVVPESRSPQAPRGASTSTDAADESGDGTSAPSRPALTLAAQSV